MLRPFDRVADSQKDWIYLAVYMTKLLLRLSNDYRIVVTIIR